MTNLNSDQKNQAENLLNKKRRRLRLRKSNFEEGGVERELSSFFSGIAGSARNIGILELAVGDRDAAEEAFADATTYYERSAAEDSLPVHSARQRMQGVYTALLAGEESALVDIAESMQRLAAEEDCDPDDQWADRYFLGWCLSGAVLGTVNDAALAGLETVNDEKPSAHAHYGRAVLSTAHGIRDDEPAAIQSGIKSMVTFHEQDMDADNVVKQIMSVEATALAILGRAKGYSPAISSEFIPMDLVEASAASFHL
ncbi:hypothetical protein Har1131_20555 [Haloarcula sp. CBA1131]|uniref:hypothetical protein n=1 Tax=Haloarcula sp. CBA1131 TaxID=1853686 RepID=UPI001244FB6E|nr:hypothetical protein [Haloarcula sp. CBA1131]KAA9401010.1 hypothetical protein Har1131_20555 [Haloarcula sp. CBA1131]